MNVSPHFEQRALRPACAAAYFRRWPQCGQATRPPFAAGAGGAGGIGGLGFGGFGGPGGTGGASTGGAGGTGGTGGAAGGTTTAPTATSGSAVATAAANGGAIHSHAGVLELTGSDFQANTASADGGAVWGYPAGVNSGANCLL
ncbi:MAG: hypothetical protein ABR611_16180, partial [Chthoniobacterales bacterium]